MLSTLRLHNFIVIEEQTVQFDEGFTALSGESGAGKSVLVRALDFVCGGKLSLSPIRSDKLGDAEVEAQFTDVASLDLVWLEPGTNEGSGEIVLRRTFSSNGRTRGWVNGRLVTQAQLLELAELSIPKRQT
jgi:DNA repair protein RecN (Recombination protein N)